MLYSSTIIAQDNKFKGIVINNITSDIIFETDLYVNKRDAVNNINTYLHVNSEQIEQTNNKTNKPITVPEIQPTITTVIRRCCGN
jgi:uncharacterized protein YegP (UPF0339 family)